MSGKVRVRYTDILLTFSNILFDRFGLDVYDVIQDYPRACFMTDLDVARSERYMTKHVDDYMTMTVFYFPSNPDDSTAENLIMQEDLRDLFLIDLDSLVSIKNKIGLEVLELRNGIVDNVLQVKIDMVMSHKYHSSQDVELMNDLEVEI